MKLQSMTDYVLEQTKLLLNGGQDNFSQVLIKTKISDSVINYATFLKLPLTLGMFITTDENGNVLEEPKKYVNWNNYDYSGTDIGFEDERLCRQFQQAKDRVIFEGFEYRETTYDIGTLHHLGLKMNRKFIENSKIRLQLKDIENKTIEDLVKYNLTIKETAVKKYGL